MPITPNLLVADGAITSTVAINTDSDTQAVAAPGAGFRLRLWAYSFAAATANTGALWCLAKRGASVTFVGALSGSAKNGDHLELPGGTVLGTNEALQLRVRSDVASQVLRWVVQYTIEAV
jgi:hypothetical protein